LILLSDLIGFQGPPGKTFEIVIQLGAILAVIVVYWRDLIAMATGFWTPRSRERYAVVNLLLAFIPAMVLGALLHKTITEVLFNPYVVCFALIIGGIALIIIERNRPKPSIHSIAEIGPLSALLIGFGQVLAMIPGTSRSGATIIFALLFGVERKVLLAIPTMLAATVYSLYKARAELAVGDISEIAIGFFAAFVVALLVVRWVLRHISRMGFQPFGWYRIALGLVMLALLSLR
ncbi:MAG: undecaprenyl-diphosphate phosphatase, partial [Acetobacteraceae bacterium]|nr:undecaprenyl-diphosphate phosphatase [Acetobacteraceae bacterium]